MLGQSDEDLRLSFQQSAVPQAITGRDGRFTSVNTALCRLLGRPAEWLLGRAVGAVLHPWADPELRQEVAQLGHGEVDAVSGEVVARHADGRTLQLLVDVSTFRDRDGAPRGLVLAARDLTTVRSAEERLVRQERLYHALANRAADAALITDADLVVTFASPTLLDLVGLELVDVFSGDAIDLLHPDDRTEVRAVVDRVAAEPGASDRCLTRIRSASGWRGVELTVLNSLADPDVGGLILNLRDVTAELEAQRAVRASEARYRAVVESAHEGIVTLDAADRVDLANGRLADILGLSPADVLTSGAVQGLLEQISRGPAPRAAAGLVRHEISYERPDGTERMLSVSSTPLPDAEEHTGRLVMVSDITEARLLQEQLRHQALHDQLTGLPNRYLFEDRLKMAAARQERAPQGSTAVMYLDLDRFKAVNDTFGHAIGDTLLRIVGARLVEEVRSSDTVARLGGDEFAIIGEGMDAEEARTIAERIQANVFGRVEHDDHRFDVGASIGIALFPPHAPRRALALADTAMYQAKRLGGGGVIVFGGDGKQPVRP